MPFVRLLIVEDDPAYLYLVQHAFQEAHGRVRWELSTAEDGEEALDLLFAEENAHLALPDLILLDWNLPKVNGCEVLRRLKEHRKLRCIPVLVFSTSTAEKDIRDAYEGHANGYILKLGSVDMLAKMVESVGDFWAIVAMLLNVRRDAPAQ